MTRYAVVGPQGSGKSHVGAVLAAMLGTVATDTSALLVAEGRAARLDGEAIPWDDRRDRPARDWLVKRGNERVRTDPASLLRSCFAYGSVACGMRRPAELWAGRHLWPDLRVVWVDGRAGAETGEDNLMLSASMCDATVHNPPGTTDEELARQLAGVLE